MLIHTSKAAIAVVIHTSFIVYGASTSSKPSTSKSISSSFLKGKSQFSAELVGGTHQDLDTIDPTFTWKTTNKKIFNDVDLEAGIDIAVRSSRDFFRLPRSIFANVRKSFISPPIRLPLRLPTALNNIDEKMFGNDDEKWDTSARIKIKFGQHDDVEEEEEAAEADVRLLAENVNQGLGLRCGLAVGSNLINSLRTLGSNYVRSFILDQRVETWISKGGNHISINDIELTKRLKDPFFDNKITINPRYDSESGFDLVLGYDIKDEEFGTGEISLFELYLSKYRQMLGASCTLQNGLYKIGATFSTFDSSPVSIILERRLSALAKGGGTGGGGGDAVTATFTPKDSVCVTWKDGPWVANLEAPFFAGEEGRLYRVLNGENVNLSFRRRVDFF